MDRRVMLEVAAVLSIAGVLGLYFYSCSLQPISVRIGEIGLGDIGNVVRTRGHVTDHYLTSTGDLVFTLADYDDGATITVYVPESVVSGFNERDSIIHRAEIEVVGEIQEYQEELELTVRSDENLVILQHSHEVELTIEILALNPTLFEGQEVTVRGQIWNIKPSYIWTNGEVESVTVFDLRYSGRYANYTMDCLLIGYDVENKFFQGQPVIFTGIFEYHEKEARYRITSEEMTLQS